MAVKTVTTPTTQLSTTGDKMPLVGMGLWKVPNDVCAETVYQAIKAGVRMFDSSSDYGNEHESGKGLKRALDEGIVKREELFIVSKLWNTYKQPEQVKIQVRRQLADWQTDYFDLYLIHFPIALKYVDPAVRYPPGWASDGKSRIELDRAPLHLTWGAMEQLPSLGLARNIGVCSFPGALLMDLMTYAKIPPAVVQVELHPYNAQKDIVAMCEAFGIRVMAFCSFGPASWIELDAPTVKQVDPLFPHPIITKIASAHNVTPAQVLLRWSTQQGIIVIPKSLKPERMAENLASSGFDMTEEELASITALDHGFRFGNPKAFDPRLGIFA